MRLEENYQMLLTLTIYFNGDVIMFAEEDVIFY